jgi:hypothetical protein
MKCKLLSMLVLSLFIVTGALAGKGGPIITGNWVGTGQAMYVDGTPAEITNVTADLYQNGNFVYGTAQFTVIVGESTVPDTQVGQMSAYIQGNAIKGVLGGCESAAPFCLGAAIFEGKIMGNKVSGTVLDLSDGSTSVLTLHRMSD